MASTPLERISWDLYCPFYGVTASAEFTYGDRSRKTGSRYNKIRGNTYTTNKYESSIEVGSISVNTSDYLIFTHKDYDYKRSSTEGKVLLSYPHIPRFVDGLSDILEGFREGCFEERDDGYALTAKGKDAVFEIPDLYKGASLAFQPIVFIPPATDDGEEESITAPIDVSGEPGIRIYINSWDLFADATLAEYEAFIMFYNRFDLFNVSLAAAQIAVVQMNGVSAARGSGGAIAQQPQRVTNAAPLVRTRTSGNQLGGPNKITKGKRDGQL
jgi:hypothetical protein